MAVDIAVAFATVGYAVEVCVKRAGGDFAAVENAVTVAVAVGVVGDFAGVYDAVVVAVGCGVICDFAGVEKAVVVAVAAVCNVAAVWDGVVVAVGFGGEAGGPFADVGICHNKVIIVPASISSKVMETVLVAGIVWLAIIPIRIVPCFT